MRVAVQVSLWCDTFTHKLCLRSRRRWLHHRVSNHQEAERRLGMSGSGKDKDGNRCTHSVIWKIMLTLNDVEGWERVEKGYLILLNSTVIMRSLVMKMKKLLRTLTIKMTLMKIRVI